MPGLIFWIPQVPVIAVFTKFDQFKREIRFRLEDEGRETHDNPVFFSNEVERIFHEHYLGSLRGSPPFVRLESEYFVNQLACIALISVLQE
jgi:hypothetical protein